MDLEFKVYDAEAPDDPEAVDRHFRDQGERILWHIQSITATDDMLTLPQAEWEVKRDLTAEGMARHARDQFVAGFDQLRSEYNS